MSAWFNTAAFAAPPYPTDGTSGRAILDGPGSKNVDLAISRDFKLYEAKILQFRAEMTNIEQTALRPMALTEDMSFLSRGSPGGFRQ